MNRICVYAIAKNEEKNVDAWAENVKEADAVVVLDTGSTDRTVEKLLDHGIYVEQKHYDSFRFDVARNDSLKLIPFDCNICVTTDLDERFNPGWSDILRSEWKEGVHQRASYSYRTRDEDFEQTLNWIHAPGWSWKYPCHEAMVRDATGEIWYYPDETLNLQGKLILRHWQDLGKSRGSYLGLLRIRRAENPDDAFSYLYLLRELSYKQMWDEIVGEAGRIHDAIRNYNGKDANAALAYLGDAYAGKGDIAKAMAAYYEAIQRSPCSRYPYEQMARYLIEDKKPELARRILLQCLEKSSHDPSWEWLDGEALWTWKIYDWLCVAAYWSDDFEEAVRWANLALEKDPSNVHVMKNLEVSKQRLS